MANVTVPSTTAQFSQEISPAVNKYYVEGYKRLAPKLEMVAQVSDQVDFNQQTHTTFGIGELPVVTQGDNFPVDAPITGYSTTYTPVKNGALIQVTREMQQYDKSGVFKVTERARDHGESAAHTVSKNIALVYNRGFNPSYISYGDGKPLFSTIHPRADGSTAQSNASASGITLTYANLETAIIAFRQQLTDRGLGVASVPGRLLVPTALEGQALSILKSSGRAGTADNDQNFYLMKEFTGSFMDLVSWRFFDGTASLASGSDTAWFLIDPDAVTGHKINWLWSVRPQVGEANLTEGYRNETIYFRVLLEASTGWSDWRSTWGSKGDGAAYSS